MPANHNSPACPPTLSVMCSWEPECTLLALAYEHTIELCRTRPAFERFASISIAESVAGACSRRWPAFETRIQNNSSGSRIKPLRRKCYWKQPRLTRGVAAQRHWALD